MADIADRIRKVVTDVVGPQAANHPASAPFSQLDGWESLNVVNLMIAIEDEFGVGFTPEQAGELVSIDAIARVVTSMGAT